MADELALTGLAFFILTLLGYIVVVFLQYRSIKPEIERLVVLLTRCALFLPLYSLFIFIGLCQANSLAVMDIFIAIVEGYSFYCFLALMVANVGGPSAVVNYMRESGRALYCCTNCCPSEHDRFYKRTTWALFHFVFTRSTVEILAAVCFYSGSRAGKALYVILSLVALAILIYALAHFVLLYENIYQQSKNLNGIVKVWLLKFSVGLIVLQGLIEEFMISLNSEPYDDDNSFTKEQKTERGYCILVLLEFVILLLAYVYAFGLPIELSSARAATADGSTTAPSSPTFFHFLCQVFCVHDVFGSITYNESGTNEPLSHSAK